MVSKLQWVVCLGLVTWVAADITVFSLKTHHQVDVEFRDVPARFGASIPPQGIRTVLVLGEPEDGCSTMVQANTSAPNFTGRWAVLLRRYNCSFELKVRNAQAAGFDMAVVHNVNSSELEPMSANDPRGIHIAAIFISEFSGYILRGNYLYNYSYYIIVDDESPFDINAHLLFPFAIVVGLCFCTMLGFMVVKCIKDHRRARRHRLPSSSLKKIPIAKFRKGDPYETCAICLDDFVEEEKLRILPCSHAYHCKCVDPWLTRNRRVCPVCKRKVFAADEVRPVVTDSDSESEVDDRTPLVRASATTTQGGTFDSEFLRVFGGRRHSAPDTEAAGPSTSAPTIQEADPVSWTDAEREKVEAVLAKLQANVAADMRARMAARAGTDPAPVEGQNPFQDI